MSSKTIRMLLVEDDPEDAFLLTDMLAGHPEFKFSHVRALGEVPACISDAAPDVVLLDLSLPDSRGIETVLSMRELAPESPIIVLTGLNDQELAVKAMQEGAQDYLIKGEAQSDLLVRTLRYAIERYRILARLKEFDRLKTEFLSTASHELRTPLTIIREFVSLVCDGAVGPITPEQAEFLGSALSNCDRLTMLINDLLDLARIETGKLRLVRTRVALPELLERCYSDFLPRCRSKNQRLSLNVPADLPPVLCDSDKILQVLINLVGNAHKFTHEGGKIEIRARRSDGAVSVEVEDNGAGISKSDQALIFEAFAQIDRLEGPGAKGTGLGLSIAREIVQLHGGTISVESEPGCGSRFAFTLAVYREDEELAAFVADRSRAVGGRGKPRSLLLLRTSGPDALLRKANEAAQKLFRTTEQGFVATEAGLLAFLLETDSEGSLTIVQRLGRALGWQARESQFEYAVLQLVPERSVEEQIQEAKRGFAPLTLDPTQKAEMAI